MEAAGGRMGRREETKDLLCGGWMKHVVVVWFRRSFACDGLSTVDRVLCKALLADPGVEWTDQGCCQLRMERLSVVAPCFEQRSAPEAH